jgi:biotin synthase
MTRLIDKLKENRVLSKDEYVYLLENITPEVSGYLHSLARQIAVKHFGRDVYMRGLIEFTNICKNNCYYCGIRRGNKNVSRYRLTKEEILKCCRTGHELGFRTFVLQGGEDPYYTDNLLVDIISSIKREFPDCAITLSLGEKTYEQYQMYFEAGAERYLLRHETANSLHYEKLHPSELSIENRKKCLHNLKKIGYQTGTGFMVGSPYQTAQDLADDLLFLYELKPEMIGIGPFIPHKDTIFKDCKTGSLQLALVLISILRLMFPTANIPSTTALGTIDPNGREMGIMAGANVVMPNLSPVSVREKYMLYNGKICTGEESAECRMCLGNRMKKIGYSLVVSRGDYKKEEELV